MCQALANDCSSWGSGQYTVPRVLAVFLLAPPEVPGFCSHLELFIGLSGRCTSARPTRLDVPLCCAGLPVCNAA